LANHKSALKRIKQSEKRRLRNRQANSQLKTMIKTFYGAVAEENECEALALVHRKTVSAIDRAATKGILHKKTAARKISRVTAFMNRSRAAVVTAG